VACLVWTGEGDSVVGTPTPHQTDYWDNSYSSFQSIICPLFYHFQNTVLGANRLTEPGFMEDPFQMGLE
jgi:hypothetical protein